MYFPYFFFIIPLLHCSCFAVVSSKNERSINTILQVNRHNEVNKIKFNEMIADVQYLILEFLNLVDLMAMIEAAPNWSPAALTTFRRQYKNYEIMIRRADLDDKIYGHLTYDDYKTMKRIDTYNFNVASNILKHFGQMIQKVNIQNESNRHFSTKSSINTVAILSFICDWG